jgi:hypothetical protein
MQTFLPYPEFDKSAKVLDRLRLGKQRVECLQIVEALAVGHGWIHHPAVKMWQGFDNALIYYGFAICDEWIGRGYKDTVREKLEFRLMPGPIVMPPWIGDSRFHLSHQSNLLRKDLVYYGKYAWTVDQYLPYWWPTQV